MARIEDWPAGSWPELTDRLDAAAAMARWAVREPVLGSWTSVRALPAALAAGTDRDRADAVLGALVRCAARDGGDDPDAALVVLHLLRHGACALAGRFPGWGDAALPTVLSELTCRIRSFPWQRRTRAVAANLLLDTKHRLWLEDRATSAWQLVPPHDPGWEEYLSNADRGGTGADLDVLKVLRWAARHGVAPAEDLALLLAVEQAPHGAVGGAAAGLGVHPRTLRRRRARTLAALRGAASRYWAAA